ncbi:MAG: N-acetylneuraminate synthase family protein [Spirochaetaceae bacterium]
MELVAEIGTGHNGSLDNARRLLDEVADAGFDCAKFQWVIAAEIIHPHAGLVPLPGGPTPLYERFKQLEQTPDFYHALKQETEVRGLSFLCTPFGLGSLQSLVSLHVSRIKVASPELSHTPLLNAVADLGLPVIASTGVNTLGDIDEANRCLRSSELTFLHCVTAYPAPENEYNLRSLKTRSAATGREWGVSDHSLDPVAVPLVACSVGASMLEKHVTLTRAGTGLDDPVSLEPQQFREMVREVRSLEREQERGESVRERLGSTRVERILGISTIELADSEQGNYGRTNRSIHATRALARGEIIDESNTSVLRTEKELNPGLHPRYYRVLTGKKTTRAVSDGAGITWDDVLT